MPTKDALIILAANSIVDAAKLVQNQLDLDDPADAVEVVQLLIQASADGLNKRFGANPLRSEEFADDAAVDCEHIESLLFLPPRSVRKMYLRVYRGAFKTKPATIRIDQMPERVRQPSATASSPSS